MVFIATLIFALYASRGQCADAAPAAPPSAVYLSYEDAAKLALDENVDLAALRAQEEALKLRSRQALAPNNPVLIYNMNDAPGFDPTLTSASQVYQLTFTLGFPGKALSQSASLRHQAEAARENAIGKEVDLLISLSNIYVSFAINDILYRMLLDNIARDQNLLKLLEKKFATSQAAKVDLLNAKVTVANDQQSLLANRNDLAVMTTQFRQLIRRPEEINLYPRIPRDIAIPNLSKSFDELSHLMLKNRHMLIATEKSVESAQAALTLASLQPFPDFQLMTALNVYNIQSAEPNPPVARDYSFGVGIAIPLFFPFSELTGIRAARQDLLSAEAQSQSARLGSIADLQTTYTSFIAAQKEMDNLVKLVVPAAKSSYDLMLLTYSLGRADYFRLNDARRTWLDSETALLSKRQSAAQLFNQFISQVGCDFSKTEGPHVCEN